MDLKDADFVACLALYQNRRDTAIGLSHITTKQKGLIWYYNILKTESYNRLIAMSFNLGVIRGARKRIKEIVMQTKLDTPIEEANKLYQEALRLQDAINKATESING